MRKMVGYMKHIAQYDLRDFKGRIFFVSDLHGCYDLLHFKLKEVGFDSTRDLLFCGGDWTDRGPDSKYVLDYLHEPWVHSVQANHEAMFIEAHRSGWAPWNRSVKTLKAHGGEWCWHLSKEEGDAICEMFESLPIAIEILLPWGGKAGIIHAEVPYDDWDQWLNITSAEYYWNAEAVAQWARTKYDRSDEEKIKGVDFVLCGHTPTDSGEIEKLGNQIFTDAGSFFRDQINFIEVTEQFAKWASK